MSAARVSAAQPGPPGVTSHLVLTNEVSWLILTASGSPSLRHMCPSTGQQMSSWA